MMPRRTAAAVALGLLASLVGVACVNPDPPVVEATFLGDTHDSVGPYAISAIVRDRDAITALRLSYRSAELTQVAVVELDPLGDDRYEGQIPGYPVGTEIRWSLEAEDAAGNLGYAPWQAELGDAKCLRDIDPDAELPADGAVYCFTVLP